MNDRNNDDFWLFGYGSLIWKPPPHYDRRIPGYVKGYVRRFWQASEDHRGTPEAPGRVATLIEYGHWKTLNENVSYPSEKVWGAAYHFPASKVSEVCSYLDIREVNGYSVQYTPFYAADGPGIAPTISSIDESSQHPTIPRCLVYVGLPDNPQFVGLQDPESLAAHILRSSGPSGLNKEYLYELEKALMELRGSDCEGPDESRDEHVSDLVERCRRLEAIKEVEIKEGNKVENKNFQKVISKTAEQIEIDKAI